jgi:general secretion pathway protein D
VIPRRMRRWVMAAAVAALATPVGSLAAQEGMTLRFENADVRDVVRTITAVLGLNVLIAQDVPAKRVTYVMPAPVPLRDVGGVLEAILESEGLVLVNRGPVAQVTLAANAPATGPLYVGTELPTPRPVGLITQLVPLRFIGPDEGIAVLRQLASPLARLEQMPRTNAILITDHASNVARYLDLLRQLDAQVEGDAGRRTYVYRLQHATAVELAATLAQVYGVTVAQAPPQPRVQALSDRSLSRTLQTFRQRDLQALEQRRQNPTPTLSAPAAAAPSQATGQAGQSGQASAAAEPGPGITTTIVPDQATNALVIRTEPPNYPILRQTIEELDVRPPQVLLEVYVADIRLDESTQYGINWAIFRRSLTGQFGPQQFTDSALGNTQSFLLRAVHLEEGLDARAVLQALATTTNVHVLAQPHVLALNNEEARILVGSQVPFTQSTRTGLDVVVDQTVQYRDVGVQLTIKPTINDDGYVTFRILQEASALTSQTVAAALGARIISTREAETSALVRDGQTVIIGGLISEQTDVTETGIPVLRDIPLLGRLFRSRQTDRSRNELAIFVTPYVVRTDAAADSLMRRARERMGELKGLTPLLPDSARARPEP